MCLNQTSGGGRRRGRGARRFRGRASGVFVGDAGFSFLVGFADRRFGEVRGGLDGRDLDLVNVRSGRVFFSRSERRLGLSGVAQGAGGALETGLQRRAGIL